MHKKLQKSNSEGFTIIEVLIVLAIAGLIIAIVLFAVPTLQRNGRNTAIKSDANQLLSYVSDFNANNDGAMPNTANSNVVTTSGLVTIGNGSGTVTTGKIRTGTTTNFPAAVADGTNVTAPATGTINVYYGNKCNTTSGTITLGASTRSTAVVYSIESSGSNVGKCVGS